MLQAIHIRKQFQRSSEVLRDVSFTLSDGEFLSVIGPSGAGKTTLFRILNGTELCSGGEVLYGGTHFEAARGREKRALQQGIGTIYQDFCLVENSTCLDNVLTACLPDMSLFPAVFGLYGRKRREEALALMDRVGLSEKAEEPVKSLSGGQKQRVAIAMAMSMHPKLLLADEPTSALDVTVQAQVVKQMMDLRDKMGTAIVIVTHNMGVASKMADYIAVMQNGELKEFGTREQVIYHPENDYTKKLLTVVPKLQGETDGE